MQRHPQGRRDCVEMSDLIHCSENRRWKNNLGRKSPAANTVHVLRCGRLSEDGVRSHGSNGASCCLSHEAVYSVVRGGRTRGTRRTPQLRFRELERSRRACRRPPSPAAGAWGCSGAVRTRPRLGALARGALPRAVRSRARVSSCV